MAGTMKKSEISESKTLNQIDNVFPTEMKENSRKVFEACKHIQFNYKDPCDRVYYSTKCMYDFNPATFVFPWIHNLNNDGFHLLDYDAFIYIFYSL